MSSALTCPDCASPLALGQRYCVECGQRVRPLPHSVASTLAAMAVQRRVGADRLTPTAAAGGATTSTGPGPRLTLFGAPLELPSPRALAVAVMAVLAFGVIIGTSSFSLASSPLLVTVNRPTSPAAAAPTTTPLALSSPTPSSSSAPATSGSSNSSPAASNPQPAPSSSSSSNNSSSSDNSSSSSSSSSSSTSSSSGSSDGLPPIKHVWVIELGDQGYASTFDNTSKDTYLNKTLASQGEVVPNVYASATSDLANEIALVTGQGPTPQTEDDCPQYSAITPGTITNDQVAGSGCVYPQTTPSLESELTTAGDSWKAYVQGQGITSTDSCIMPSLGSDPTVGVSDSHFTPSSATGYVSWRNPFIYLDDVTSSGSCGYQDTGLARLKSDLAEPAATPDVSFIYPNSCDDGSDTPCLPGAASGTKESDKFLKSIVPEIMASAAYKQDGMILITFAQAPQSGIGADPSSCCDQPVQYPNLPTPDYEPSPSAGTTTTATGTTGTDTTGTDTTASGTATVAPVVADTVATTTSAASVTTSPATATATGITLPDLPGPLGTTTMPGGIVTGTNPTVTDTAGTSGTGTSSTGTSSTGTSSTVTSSTVTSSTETSTAGTDTTGTSTTACPTTTPETTTTATDPTSTPDTTTTATDPTSTPDTTTTATDPTTTPGATTTDTTDTAGSTTTGTTTTTTECPSLTSPGPDSTSPTGGGGQTGMLVLSKYVSPNLQDGTDYFNTFSITASLEQLFGLKYTGYAATPGLPVFSGFLYSKYSG